MNGIEKITQRIFAEAKAECLAVSEDAAQRCAAIQDDFAQKAAAAYEDVVVHGKKDIEQFRIREDRSAKLEAKKEILALKQDLIQNAYSKATELILSMPDEQYSAFLAKLAASAALNGEGEVIFSAADAEKYGSCVVASANALLAKQGKKAQLLLSSNSRPLSGGLVVKNGDVEVNCSVSTLVEQSRNELSSKVADILFA